MIIEMAATAAFDIPKLRERVKAIAATYKESAKEDTEGDSALEESSIYQSIRGILRNLVLNVQASDPNYWRRAGLRMVDPTTFTTCLDEVKKNSKVLGQGFYGRVLNVPTAKCFDQIPADVKHFGLKIEMMKWDFDRNQVPEQIKMGTDIAKKAGKLGIGPDFYDVFITTDSEGSIVIIKAFEIIDGESWMKKDWKDDERAAALVKLDKSISIMNKAGIIHHDLHPGNVMVTKTGEVYIIDYDLAKFAATEEHSRLSEFDETSNPWEPTGVASNKGVLYVYKALLKEGTIRLPTKSAPSRKTRKAKRAGPA
jgi:predicted Ser/Thr protein kinase